MSYNLRTGLTGSADLDINVNLQNLDASNITSGTFTSAQIPNLDAAKITTGLLDVDRIPALNATQITTGQFPDARISDVSAAKVTGQLDPDTQVDFLNKDIDLGTGDFAASTLEVTTKVLTPEIDTTSGNTNVTMRCPLDLNGNTIQNCPSLDEIHTNAIGYAATGTVVNNEHFYRIPAARFVSSDDRCPLVSDYGSGGLKLSGTPSTTTRLVATFQVPEGWFLASIRVALLDSSNTLTTTDGAGLKLVHMDADPVTHSSSLPHNSSGASIDNLYMNTTISTELPASLTLANLQSLGLVTDLRQYFVLTLEAYYDNSVSPPTTTAISTGDILLHAEVGIRQIP